MTESKLGTITPGRYRMEGGGVAKITRCQSVDTDDGRPVKGHTDECSAVGWTISGKYGYGSLDANGDYDLSERIGDLEDDKPYEGVYCESCKKRTPHNMVCVVCLTVPSPPMGETENDKPFQMREGKCRLRDGGEGVAVKHDECGWKISIKGEKGTHRVHDNGLCGLGAEFFVDVVAMLDDEPLVIEAGFFHETESMGKVIVICDNWTGDYPYAGHPVRHNIMDKHNLLLWNKKGESDTGQQMSEWDLACPHTPAPKQVYRMVDESMLFKFAICYWYEECSLKWYQSDVSPTWNESEIRYLMTPNSRLEYIPAKHAPQNLPDDFDWRDSLVMVEEK